MKKANIMNRVKHFLILVLALTMSFGAWAQTNTTVQVTKDNNLDWNFTMPDYDAVVGVEYYPYTLTLIANGNGTVGFSGDTLPQGVTAGTTANTYLVVPGTEVAIKATAAEGYIFTDWNDQNTDNPRIFTVVSDTTFTANFAVETYTVTLNDGGVDANNWTGKVGDATTFSAFPLEGVTATQTVTVKYDGTRKVKSITLVPVAPEPVDTLILTGQYWNEVHDPSTGLHPVSGIYSFTIVYGPNDTWGDMVDKYDWIYTTDYSGAPDGKIIQFSYNTGNGIIQAELKHTGCSSAYQLVPVSTKVSDLAPNGYFFEKWRGNN